MLLQHRDPVVLFEALYGIRYLTSIKRSRDVLGLGVGPRILDRIIELFDAPYRTLLQPTLGILDWYDFCSWD